MGKAVLGSLAVLVLSAGMVLAQPDTNSAATEAPATTPMSLQEWCTEKSCECPPGQRLWVHGEYLVWWIKDGPQPDPLVTLGSEADFPLSGALGQPGTSVLFGGQDLDYGTFSGGRLTVGLMATSCLGIEGSGFLLEDRTQGFSTSSNPLGIPIIAIPVIDAELDEEDTFEVSFPGFFDGAVSVSSSSRLRGADASVVGRLCHSEKCTWDLLGGFRYLELDEDLRLNLLSENLVEVPLGVFGFQPAGVVLGVFDRFDASNQFYGGQIGTRLALHWGYVYVQATGKVALGTTQQTLEVRGSSQLFGPTIVPGSPTTAEGGLLALPTNIGRRKRDEFTVIPEATIRIGCQLCAHVNAFVGYDFMYWNKVVRPGEQVDRRINFTQVPSVSVGPLIGPAQPEPRFKTTDFWAQGINVGFEVNW